MNVDSIVNTAMTEFKTKLKQLCSALPEGELTPQIAEAVFVHMRTALNEGGARALEAWLASMDESLDLVRVDNEVYRFKALTVKSAFSIFGPLRIERRLYQNASDERSYAPLDHAWGMADHYLTPELREMALYANAHLTDGETAGLLEKCLGRAPHATQIKKCVEQLGALCEASGEALLQEVRQETQAPSETAALVASLDGVNVPLREKGAKTGRPRERPGGDGEQKASAWRNAMVGSVSCYGVTEKDGESGPEQLLAVYTARMPEKGFPTFRQAFEAEVTQLESCLPGGAVKVLLLDGARNLWRYAENSPSFEGYLKLVDYWHALEHLSRAGEALFGKDCDEARRWYYKWKNKLKEEHGAVLKLVRSMRRYAREKNLRASRLKSLEREMGYFRRNASKMDYAGFRAKNLPIGSGPVEAACKSIVRTRMCRSGMRWSTQGGQTILTLRAIIKSGRWDSFWREIRALQNAA